MQTETRQTGAVSTHIFGHFTAVPNEFLRNPELSTNARMLGIFIQSHHENFFCSRGYMAKAMGRSKPSIMRDLSELEQAGYLIRDQERGNNGQFGRTKYIMIWQQLPPEHPERQGHNTSNDQPQPGITHDTPSPGIKNHDAVCDTNKNTNPKNTNPTHNPEPLRTTKQERKPPPSSSCSNFDSNAGSEGVGGSGSLRESVAKADEELMRQGLPIDDGGVSSSSIDSSPPNDRPLPEWAPRRCDGWEDFPAWTREQIQAAAREGTDQQVRQLCKAIYRQTQDLDKATCCVLTLIAQGANLNKDDAWFYGASKPERIEECIPTSSGKPPDTTDVWAEFRKQNHLPNYQTLTPTQQRRWQAHAALGREHFDVWCRDTFDTPAPDHIIQYWRIESEPDPRTASNYLRRLNTRLTATEGISDSTT